MREDDDEKLVSQYLKGDEKSLEILIGKYLKPVYGFVYRYVNSPADAQDLTQEAFVRAWRNLKKPVLGFYRGFDPNKGSFKTWIFSIAKNASFDFIKKKKSIPFSEFDDEEGSNAVADTLADPAPLPFEILERLDVGRRLDSALEKLAPAFRAVLILRYNDHFTFREIAESLGESINTIKSRHRRALIMLKKLLGE